jgi:hypothetical protein
VVDLVAALRASLQARPEPVGAGAAPAAGAKATTAGRKPVKRAAARSDKAAPATQRPTGKR